LNIASIKLHSKSYKQIYIEWIHGKSLRNKELQRSYHRFACSLVFISSPSYPTRLKRNYQFESIGGFNQHPNSTQEL
jgi:hypothetical protein